MLLAIDTATAHASVALHDGMALRSECTWEAANMHTVTLLPHMTRLLNEVGVTPKQLSAIAVCIGPGSYTGVRIGVAAAQGLAAALSVPLVGVPTLDILALAQPPDERPLYAVFIAGRNRIGYARYRHGATGWQAETEVAIDTWQGLVQQIGEPALVVGELDASARAVLQAAGDRVVLPAPAWHLRRAGFLAELGWQRLRAGEQGLPNLVVPRYAR